MHKKKYWHEVEWGQIMISYGRHIYKFGKLLDKLSRAKTTYTMSVNEIFAHANGAPQSCVYTLGILLPR